MAMILIVEDEVFIRQSAEYTIGDEGHGVLLAGDVDEAMSHLTSSQPIDGLFVDMRLGAEARGGCEVANEAVKLWPGLAVLYTSGRTVTPEMAEQFVDGGKFLQKPYSPKQLLAAIDDMLGPSITRRLSPAL